MLDIKRKRRKEDKSGDHPVPRTSRQLFYSDTQEEKDEAGQPQGSPEQTLSASPIAQLVRAPH